MNSPPALAAIDVTTGFDGAVLGPIPVDDAARRLLAYCTEPGSGWVTYDLTGRHAREAGAFGEVTSWSLLYANALNGQVTLPNVAAFDQVRRREFARRVARVPDRVDLHDLSHAGIDAVVDVCLFGFPGVWGPKATKLAALYRPHGVPVLDGHIAEAFGLDREGFTAAATQRSMTRQERVRRVVEALAAGLATHSDQISQLRHRITPTVPELAHIPDLRLMDMVIWTAQDDRMTRRARQGSRWIDRPIGAHIPGEHLRPEPITA